MAVSLDSDNDIASVIIVPPVENDDCHERPGCEKCKLTATAAVGKGKYFSSAQSEIKPYTARSLYNPR